MILDDVDVEQLSPGSHFTLTVVCDEGVSSKCRGEMRKQYKTVLRDRAKSNGKDICLYCSRMIKFSGRSNPNCKYRFRDDILKEIDTPEKAYLLGWIASDGSIRKSGFIIAIHEKDILVLESLRDLFDENIKIRHRECRRQVSLTINSSQISKDVCRHLGIEPGAKSKVVKFPEDILYKWAFIRGYFDGDGHVCSARSKKRSPRCSITSSSRVFLDSLSCFVQIPHGRYKDRIEFTGNNALDFLGKLYDNAGLYLARKRDSYLDWCMWSPALGGHYGSTSLFRWLKTHKDAVPPQKSRSSDSGFDLVILEKVKQYGQVELWDTGIKVVPDFGWYFDLVPRSSMIKSGYMLANCTGVIDRTYVGNILVALRKMEDDAPDAKKGDCLVQLIPRPIVHVAIEEVDELPESERGEKGFGSSGV